MPKVMPISEIRVEIHIEEKQETDKDDARKKIEQKRIILYMINTQCLLHVQVYWKILVVSLNIILRQNNFSAV